MRRGGATAVSSDSSAAVLPATTAAGSSRGALVPPLSSGAALSPLHQQQVRHSHIGKAAILVPATTKLSILPFAPVANPSRRQPTALQSARSVRVQGPRGTVLVPLQEFVNVAWDLGKGQTSTVAAALLDGSEASSSSSPSLEQSSTDPGRLTLSIANGNDKRQRATWGLTRAIIANAIEGVEEGHSAVLRLVGVGYRAAVESDPFPRPDKFDVAFDPLNSGSSLTAAANFASSQQFAYYANAIDAQRSAASADGGERKRLSLRLGYSHPVNLSVPRGLTCTTPAPTRIVIKGTDKELVGLFAAQIRRYRPPEPYKGKGVFVNDETIRLKSPRKK